MQDKTPEKRPQDEPAPDKKTTPEAIPPTGGAQPPQQPPAPEEEEAPFVLFEEGAPAQDADELDAMLDMDVRPLQDPKEKQDRTRRGRLLFAILFPVLALVLVFSVWQIIRIYRNYAVADDEYASLQQALGPQSQPASSAPPVVSSSSSAVEEEPPDIIPDHATLLAKNGDYACWVQIPDTRLSYPVVRGPDNDKYLNLTFEGTSNAAGCVFMDYRNALDFSSCHTILYGHNVKTGSMFGSLSSYLDPVYRSTHPYILVYTADSVLYYRVFSAFVGDMYDAAYQVDFTGPEAFAAFADGYGRPADTGTMLTLSTCTNGTSEERMLVMAALEKTEPNTPQARGAE